MTNLKANLFYSIGSCIQIFKYEVSSFFLAYRHFKGISGTSTTSVCALVCRWRTQQVEGFKVEAEVTDLWKTSSDLDKLDLIRWFDFKDCAIFYCKSLQ